MKNFFEKVKQSIWDNNFYAVMDSRTMKETFKYFFSLLLLTVFLSTVVITIFVVPAGLSFLRKSADLVATRYPAELQIVLGGGLATTTPAGVFSFSFPKELIGSEGQAVLSKQGLDHFLVVDTRGNLTDLKQFESARTMTLLTRNSFVVKKQNGGFEVHTIPTDMKLAVNKVSIGMWMQKAISLVKFILPILIIIGFIVLFIGSVVKYFIFAIIAGAVLWLIALLAKRRGKYKQFLKTALYAITLPIIFDFLMILITGYGRGLPLFFAIAIAVVVWALNVRIWEKASLPSTDVNEPPEKI